MNSQFAHSLISSFFWLRLTPLRKLDYTSMSDQELKEYVLNNKDNQQAFYAYLDRKLKEPKNILISVDELESLTPDLQVELVAKRLKEKFNL